jgi:hypothetical protein
MFIILIKKERFRIKAGIYIYFAIYTQEVAIATSVHSKEFLCSYQKETKHFLTNTK